VNEAAQLRLHVEFRVKVGGRIFCSLIFWIGVTINQNSSTASFKYAAMQLV
jgi:hypothetical protein